MTTDQTAGPGTLDTAAVEDIALGVDGHPGQQVTQGQVAAAARALLHVACIEDDADQQRLRQPTNIREALKVTRAVLAALDITIVGEHISTRTLQMTARLVAAAVDDGGFVPEFIDEDAQR